MAINVIAYLLEIRHGGSFFAGPADAVELHYGAIPHELTHPRDGLPFATWKTVFTSMFVHGSFLHVFANMVVLTIFGATVEDRLGRLRFALFYLLGGLIALAAQVLANPSSTVPVLGASGAIAAVLGGYLLLYPHARVISLVLIVFFATIVEIPAVLLLGLWFLEQLYVGLAGLASPVGGSQGVAYFTHIAGFAFGLLAIHLLVGHRRAQPRTRASA